MREPRPLLMVELPVPPGREDEWNAWYHDEHMPDILEKVDGVVESHRYEVVVGPNEYAYVVLHEFETMEQLEAYAESALVANRWDDYAALWGMPPHFRRRALKPVHSVGA